MSAFASEPPAPVAPGAGPAAESAGAATTTPHVALLLPPASGVLAKHAEAFRSGFAAAAKVHGKFLLPIRVHATADDPQQAVAAYRLALNGGARAIVGPLTRSAVGAIAASDIVTVPTVALNVPDAPARLPPNLFLLSLNVGAEAAQVARLAWQDGRRNVITVVSESPVMKRLVQSFLDEFSRLGGKHVAEYAYTADLGGLKRLNQAAGLGLADAAFLAVDAPRARIVRPYLTTLPLYASSHVHPGNAGFLAGHDLAGIRFLDMPWLLQPDHPAVMVYPRAEFGEAIDLDRLYALGIDAFRVMLELLEGRKDIALDGVTGRIVLGRDQQFSRGLTGAAFFEGKIQLLGPANP